MHLVLNAAFLTLILVAALLPRAKSARTNPLVRRPRGSTLFVQNKEAGRKPPKGWRKLMGEREETAENTVQGKMDCGKSYAVNSKSKKYHTCPDECPFYAQDRTDDLFCTFRCVENVGQCSAMNPKTVIADKDRGICRKPMVQSCREYNMDGTDTCKVCSALYRVGPDGQCYSKLQYPINCLGILLLIVAVVLVVWVLDLAFRPINNTQGVKDALAFRSLQKLRTAKEDGRKVWELSTNLLRQTVAGPGMLLHFNFQFMVILWAVLIGLGWVVLAAVVDPALYIIGTRRFGTPRDNCILVAWGFEKQQGLMWSKVLFLVIVYLASFVCSILHGVRQLRIFQMYDFENKTMKDFVALAEGLPDIKGSEKLEEELVKCIEEFCDEKPVGVSVCWDMRESAEEVAKILENDLVAYEAEQRPQEEPEVPHRQVGLVRQGFMSLEDSIFGPEPAEEGRTEASVKELLENMKTSSNAFVVFNSEASRNAAVEKTKDGMDFKGGKVHMVMQLSEPNTVEWQNFGHSSYEQQIFRLCQGFGAIFLALVFWTVVFYFPYAWSIFSFNYDNGQEPGAIYGLSFSMVVVVGNQIMYEVCARVSEHVGFRFSDDKAVCYMILFTVACLYNVLVDVVTTYFMAEQIMMELGFRTYYGQRLEQVPTFTERFETYAMQRSLAENTFEYAFPSTYLIPFVIEPLATIIAPLFLGIWVVRTHPEIKGRCAEGLVGAIPMDLGRYADILLNMALAILIFFFPGGYTHWLFLSLAGSHVLIYALDHWRLLRSVPSIHLSTMVVDWWCQVLLAPCCAGILSCLVFKANCQEYGFCLTGIKLIGTCTLAFVGHCVVHVLLLVYVVPMMGKSEPEDDPCADVTFKDIATHHPCSWFNANPVHCLRSKYIYQHDPPCRFLISGKEHLMQVNEGIGCYFEDKPAKLEDYSNYTGEKALMAKKKPESLS